MPAEDYTEDTAIAKGVFGVVYKIRHIYSDAVFAMKEGKVDAHLVSPISEALAVHTGSGHPNILKCNEHFYDSNMKKMCIVTDFCDGGNLENYIIETDPSAQVTLALMRQMADAIRFAHENGIVHGDIKPGNVLIKVENNKPIAKIADFGLGKITGTVSPPPPEFPLESYMTESGRKYMYMAPEVFEGCHTEKADVFSLGVIFCAILERLVLNIPGRGLELVIIYDNDIQFPIGLVLQQNPHAVRLVLPMITVPGETTSLVEAMLYSDNSTRPCAEEVYKSLKLKSTTRCPNCSVL